MTEPLRASWGLPIESVANEVISALTLQRRVLVVAPPGAGKTTLLPIRLMETASISGRIVVLEPRRLAARAAATRMAEMLGEPVGETVGFATRDERKVSGRTRIEVLTEGILTRRLQNDPELAGVAVVLFDEVHERHLTTDLGLALAIEVAESIRPDLMIGAMSATPDTDRIRRILGDCPVVESDGRLHPVEVIWAPVVDRRNKRGRVNLEQAMASTILRALTEQDGDVLAFLPGVGEIERTHEALRSMIGPGIDVRRLAGSIPFAEQDEALSRSPSGRRRVVLSTDIAESSLTVEGIRVVVDAGLARVPRHDPATQMSRLATITASRDSADQRAGRAGRVEPGACYRLWSAVEHGSRVAHRQPEIADADLAGLVLECAAWGTPVEQMRLLTPPSAGQMRTAQELLTELGALDEDNAITDLGRQLVNIPLHPRLAAMVIAQPDSLSLLIAALLDDRDILRGRPDERPSDLSLRIGIIAGDISAERYGADRSGIRRIIDRSHDLAKRTGITFSLNNLDPDGCGIRLLHAYPDRLAAQRRQGQFQMRTGTAAWVPTDDPIGTADLLVAADLDGRRDRARIRLAAHIDMNDAVDILGRNGRTVFNERRRLEWDHERDDLTAVVERRLGAIRFDERRERPTVSPETTQALLARVRETGLAVLDWTPLALSLRQRVRFLHAHRGDPWPDWSTSTLLTCLDDWLAPYLTSATGRSDLESLDIAMLLRASLEWPLGADLDQLAPDRLDLPSGRSVPVTYEDGVGALVPIASARVQDLFGVTDHPSIDGVPIVLHLLSPADRPLQITSDLPSFWTGAWTEVRREMAGRYPKHHWPLDPSAANPRRLKRDEP